MKPTYTFAHLYLPSFLQWYWLLMFRSYISPEKFNCHSPPCLTRNTPRRSHCKWKPNILIEFLLTLLFSCFPFSLQFQVSISKIWKCSLYKMLIAFFFIKFYFFSIPVLQKSENLNDLFLIFSMNLTIFLVWLLWKAVAKSSS